MKVFHKESKYFSLKESKYYTFFLIVVNNPKCFKNCNILKNKSQFADKWNT